MFLNKIRVLGVRLRLQYWSRNEDQNIPYELEYPIIRVGIYFENSKDFSGGLKIKKKSHKYFIFNFRNNFNYKKINADTFYEN